MTSRLLIDEPPLLVLRSLARIFGLNEAMILQQIHYRQTSDRNKNHFDGRVWVRNTYEEWGEEFPFWAKNTIVRTIDKLSDQRLILTYMEQAGFRNQKFYSVDYDKLNEVAGLKLSSAGVKSPLYMGVDQASGNSEIDLPKMGRSTYQSETTSKSSCETYTYKDQRGNAEPNFSVGENRSPYKEQPTPTSISGLEVCKNVQMVGVDPGVQSADYEISGSQTTQEGLFDLPNLGRPSTQNGYAEIPNLGKSYTEAESFLRDINLPPLTPPNLKSEKGEDEDDLNQIGFKKAGGAAKPSSSCSNASGGSDASGGPANPSSLRASEEEQDLSQRMIKVWNRLVQSKIKDVPRKELMLTDTRKKALEFIFNGILDGDFAEWERYCERIAGTRFLLGNNDSGFRVNLEWALSASNALKVLEGQIYDKPAAKEIKLEKASGEFNQDIEDLFKSNNYPAEWFEVYRGFARHKGQATFDAWLKPCVPLATVDGQAVLIAPTRFFRDHMSANYLYDLTALAHGCWKNQTEIKIEVKA